MWLCICCISLPSLLWAQPAPSASPVSGVVLDAETLLPVPGATIRSAAAGTLTDSLGRFTLQASGTLTVTCLGYMPLSVSARSGLRIQLKPSSTQLAEVQIVGLQPGARLQDLPASIGVRTEADITRTNATTLAPVLNTIPGVRMDQSTLSEARISIRGSGVRAGFGNRNLRFYLNDIPLTEADGFTRIEALDVTTVGRVEVIRGPASSLYGAGTGGVLHFYTRKAAYGESGLSLEALGGSYGLFRLGSRYQTGTDRMNIMASGGVQGYDGYRQQARDRRVFGSFFGQWYDGDGGGTTSLLVQHTRQDSQIPGALITSQVDADPRQAAPNNLRQQAARIQNWTRVGLSRTQEIAPRLQGTISGFASYFDLNHPLAFAYLRGTNWGYGSRLRLDWSLPGRFPTVIRAGGELLVNQTTSQRYQNLQGREGNLLLDQGGTNRQLTLFVQSETKLTSMGTLLVLGASRNDVRYRIEDQLRLNGRDAGGTKTFDPNYAPRIAVAQPISPTLTLRTGASWGFSPPSSGEITGADGSINPNVQAERAVSYDLGARGTAWRGRITYDATLFAFPGRDELIPQTVAQNLTIFTNAGRTRKYGAELSTTALLVDQPAQTVQSLLLWANYAWSDFSFRDYRIRNAQGAITADFSGNRYTGVVRHTASLGADLITRAGIYLHATWLWTDRLPLNDANTDWNDAWNVLNLKAGYRRNLLRERLSVDVSAGLDNALNQRYSPLFALNANGATSAARPYFQPAPDRTWFAGLSLQYHLLP